MTKKMTDVDAFARSYIDAAVESQKRFGDAQEISAEEYENAVKRTTAVFMELRQAGQREPIAG